MSTSNSAARVGVVHDYLTQRGGAERVVLQILGAFPGARVRTSLYEPATTYPEFASYRIEASWLNRSGALRHRHRLALPLLAPTFSRMAEPDDVTICSSSGWAHGVRTAGRKVVYCYTPARWLYQGDTYLGADGGRMARLGLRAMRPPLRRWDRRAAATADRYLTTSTEVQRRIKEEYGREAEVLPPPPSMRADEPRQPVTRLDEGYWLCVSRLLPYKNVDALLDAFALMPREQLVVVGTGPQAGALAAAAGPNVELLGGVGEAQLRWLYANCRGLVAASHEDYGLTPLEAAVFSRPSVVPAWGGFLDTVVEEQTGSFFDGLDAKSIASAVSRSSATEWSDEAIAEHLRRFSEEHFTRRLQQIVAEEASEGRRTG